MSPTSYRAAPPRNLIVTRLGGQGQSQALATRLGLKYFKINMLYAKNIAFHKLTNAFSQDIRI
jgi:hypothetical protein